MRCTNVRRIDSAVPNPVRAAIIATALVRLECSARGLEPDLGDVLAWRHPDLLDESTLKWRSLIADAPGEPTDPVVVARLTVDQLLRLADRVSPARLIHTGAANCDWSAGRCRNITSQRATV